MSIKPKPGLSDSGQVRSLTEHRAAKTGGFQASKFDVDYLKGEIISCDNPEIAYFVRLGKVLLNVEIQAEFGNRQCITVEHVGQGEPLVFGHLFPSIKDPEVEMIAETDVVVAEIPRELLTVDPVARDLMRNVTRLISGCTARLRKAYIELLGSTQAKSDQIADDNMALQLDLGSAQRELRELREQNRTLNSRVGALETYLRESRAREVQARELSKEAYEYFQELERRQREESLQFPDMMNRVLAYFKLPSLETEDLMFVITSAVDGKTVRTEAVKPNESAEQLEDAELVDDVPIAEDGLMPVGQEPSSITDIRPRLDTIGFEGELPTAPKPGTTSGYSMVGGQIAQDDPIAVRQIDSLRLNTDRQTPPGVAWTDETPSSKRGVVMPTPGVDWDADPSLREDTRDITVPDEFRRGSQPRVEIPSQFPRVRPASQNLPKAPRPTPPVVMPMPLQNVGAPDLSSILDEWDAENERPTATGQQAIACPPSPVSDGQRVGTTTNVWDVNEIQRLKEEALKKS